MTESKASSPATRKRRTTAASRSTTTTAAAAAADETATTASEGEATEAPKKKRRKPKYTKELRRLQRMEAGLAKAGHRVSKASQSGLATYIKLRKKSASKKRDGALVDVFINVAEAQAEAMAKASPAILDVAKALNPLGDTGKERRRIAKRLSKLRPPFFM